MVAALVLAASGCNLESVRLPDGRRVLDKPHRIAARFARAQASIDFNCPESQIEGPSSSRFSGCGQSAEYMCERRERRADQDIEQELDHVWEVYYVCRRR